MQPQSKLKALIPSAVREYLQTESASGVIMLGFAAMAMILANSPWQTQYQQILNHHLGTHSLADWVKDLLMVFFFLVVGLELKREMVDGFLRQRDKILLPLFCALGGMLIPALIFLIFNHDHPEFRHGWAIPCATDIAFALCVLMLVGKKVPPAIKVFLLAIAIFDDLGAIVIIALFYGGPLALGPLLYSGLAILALFIINRLKVTAISAYIAIGAVLWYCLLHSGIHTTIAGVITGLAIPMWDPKNEGRSPLLNCIHHFHPWVSFFVLPLFALTSAGINFSQFEIRDLVSPLSLGISLGLVLGKPIGIFGTTFLLIKAKIVTPIEDATWGQVFSVSIIAGIGFTMSLFISLLAFDNVHLQEASKVGVILGSLLSAVAGLITMRLSLRSSP